MPSSSTVCIDANLVVRLVMGSAADPMHGIWRTWESTDTTFVAPFLFRYEVTNAIFRSGQARRMDPLVIREILETGFSIPIIMNSDESLHGPAISLAVRFEQPATYDAHYLALAEMMGTDFYTGDRRLWNAVHHQLPWVHLVMDEPAANSSSETERGFADDGQRDVIHRWVAETGANVTEIAF